MEDDNASASTMSNRPDNVGAYLIERLQSLGVSHVFGVPGDYVLGFFKQLSDSQLNLVTTCDELNAGYAADAYADPRNRRRVRYLFRWRSKGCECHSAGVCGKIPASGHRRSPRNQRTDRKPAPPPQGTDI
jgi:hypothetical protein